jgi:zinc protease
VAQVEAVLEKEIKRLKTELVDDKELRKAKNQLLSGFYMSMDSLFYRGMLLGKLATTADWTLVRDFLPKIEQITAEDLRRVANKYLATNNRTVGILSPQKTDKPKQSRYKPGDQVE